MNRAAFLSKTLPVATLQSVRFRLDPGAPANDQGDGQFIPEHEIEIAVTAEDIFGGRPCAPWHCPISRAVYRSTGFEASVSQRTVGFFDHGHAEPYCVADLPPKARRFVRRFDGNAFWWLPEFLWKRPFKFTLTVPDYIL